MEENRQSGPTVQKKDGQAPGSDMAGGLTTAQWRNTAIVAGILAVVFVGSYLWFQSGTQQQLPVLPPPSENIGDSEIGENVVPEAAGPTVEGSGTEVADAASDPVAEAIEQGLVSEALDEEATAAANAPATVEPGETEAAGLNFIWPVTGWISQQFGWQYSETFQDWRWHSGIDIVTTSGTPVKSAADGKVLSVKEDANWGTMIEVEYADNWVFRYGNVTDPTVEVGQEVKQGDVIAVVGPTGTIEAGQQNQLHLETVRESVERDPLTVIVVQ